MRTDQETLSLTVHEGILLVTLDRPEEMNSFTVQMADELEATFQEVNDDDGVRAVVVTGAGKAFCAGMDLTAKDNVFGLDESLTPTLEDMTDLEDPGLARVRDTGGRVALAIHACRKPVIAAINGAAVGIGATMTLPMDARLVSTKGRIGLVFGRIGITPEATSSWFLSRIVGMPTALDLVYSADILGADDALEAGLVRSVHEPDELLEAAFALADRWTKDRSPFATALTRQLMYRNAGLEHPADAHRVDSLAIFYASIGDGKEGVASFLEKRTPVYTGKASQMPPFYAGW